MVVYSRPHDPYVISEEDNQIMKEEIFPFWEGRFPEETCEESFCKEGIWEFAAESAFYFEFCKEVQDEIITRIILK